MSDRHFFYLSTPYSKYPGGLEQAFAAACRQTALLIRAKVPVFCPIAHGHCVAQHGGIDPYDHQIWLPADAPFMHLAKGLIVCMLATWAESHGVTEEIRAFRQAEKPVIYMVPDEAPKELVLLAAL